VVAQEHQRIEALVELLHHAERMAGPGADKPDIGGQHAGDEIAP